MRSKIQSLFVALSAAIFLSGTCMAADSEIVEKFLAAYDAKDASGMQAVIKENVDAVPGEVAALLEAASAPEITHEERDEKFYIAELIATKYKDLTEEMAPLIEVKKAVFNAKLSEPVSVEPTGGVYIVDMPEADGETMNVFSPDNLIVDVGSTVRWVNHDKIAHVFASMPMIGEGGIFASNVEPGGGYLGVHLHQARGVLLHLLHTPGDGRQGDGCRERGGGAG